MMKAEGLSPAPHGTIPTFPGQNKAAERLRGLEVYKRARTIMVPPDQAQLQVRVNAVLDSKRLIMATPGLRDGFYLFDEGSGKGSTQLRSAEIRQEGGNFSQGDRRGRSVGDRGCGCGAPWWKDR
ncbi:MAG: hypothetical protein JRI46_09145 [Deltaproteobacteria bacterium]|nr:hypothetical protein [Deltaproteobacteria bacterium]